MSDNPFNTPWRKTASAIYAQPSDAKIWGTYEADVSKTLEYIEKKKAQGINMTLTQVVIGAVARAYRHDVPELNCYHKRGNIYHRETVDIFISVEIPGSKEMTGFLVEKADEKTLTEINRFMTEKVERYKRRVEQGAAKSKYFLATVPWILRRPLVLIIKFFLATLGVAIKPLGVDPNSFGSVLISNIGTHKLQFGMASIMPVSNLPVVVLMGHVEKKPVVRDDQVVIRDILPFSCSLDHRVCDGGMGGRLAVAVQEYLLKPWSMDLGVEDVEDSESMEEAAG